MKIREIILAAVVVHLALNGLNFGDPAPATAIGIENGSPSPAVLAEGSDCVLVVFLDPACPRCSEVYAQAQQSSTAELPEFDLLWVMPEAERGRSLGGVFADVSGMTFDDSLFSLFQVGAVPSAVLVHQNAVVASGGIPPQADVRSFAGRCGASGSGPAGTQAVAAAAEVAAEDARPRRVSARESSLPDREAQHGDD